MSGMETGVTLLLYLEKLPGKGLRRSVFTDSKSQLISLLTAQSLSPLESALVLMPAKSVLVSDCHLSTIYFASLWLNSAVCKMWIMLPPPYWTGMLKDQSNTEIWNLSAGRKFKFHLIQTLFLYLIYLQQIIIANIYRAFLLGAKHRW